jgi:putative ABC transport system permease protein
LIALLSLAKREAGSNWRRNAVQAVILLGAIGTQMFTALAAQASQVAVRDYGSAVFGYAQTWQASLDGQISLDRVQSLDDALDVMAHDYPWAPIAASALVSVHVTSPAAPAVRPESEITLTAIHGPWQALSATLAHDPGYHEVSAIPEGNEVLASPEAASRLGIQASSTVTVYYQNAGADSSSSTPTASAPSTATVHSRALRGIAAFAGPAEANKGLTYDLMSNHRLLRGLGVPSAAVSLYWRCGEARCSDVQGLATTAARVIGAKIGTPNRVDTNDNIGPVLEQQRQQGDQFSLVVLALGAVAVTVVAVAFIEIRTPELVTLRTLGATRITVCLLAVLESVVVAALVAVIAVLLGLSVSSLDPNLLNHIPTVHLNQLAPPIDVYAKTILTTLGIGLTTSLLPAARAYRAVRAH